MAETKTDPDEPIVIKKYANRRLYNTATASFVRLEDLHQMVKDGVDFVVREDKTGRDITSSVLAQIIAEEENNGPGMLPHDYLRQVLRAYNEGVGPQLAAYLEQSMEAFSAHQRTFARQMREMFDGAEAVERIAEASRRNLEEFQRTFGMFAPASRRAGQAEEAEPKAAEDDPEALKRKVADLEARIAQLERGGREG